jgi:hypothetical protein
MQRLTRQDLEIENEALRTKLEMIQRTISDALGYEDEDAESEEDEEDEDEEDE